MVGSTGTWAKPSETRGTEAGVGVWPRVPCPHLCCIPGGCDRWLWGGGGRRRRHSPEPAPSTRHRMSALTLSCPLFLYVRKTLTRPSLTFSTHVTLGNGPSRHHRGSGDRRARNGDRASRDIVSLAGARVLTLRFLLQTSARSTRCGRRPAAWSPWLGPRDPGLQWGD